MKLSILFGLFFFCSSIYSAEPQNDSLCKADEVALFNCSLSKRTASLCFKKKTDQIQYRIGTNARKEFIYPKTLEDSINKFKLSTTPYPGGGENRIRFFNKSYDYFIYDITKSQQDLLGGGSLQTAGIVVYEGNKRISKLECSNSDTSITSLAFEILQRENFSREVDTD